MSTERLNAWDSMAPEERALRLLLAVQLGRLREPLALEAARRDATSPLHTSAIYDDTGLVGAAIVFRGPLSGSGGLVAVRDRSDGNDWLDVALLETGHGAKSLTDERWSDLRMNAHVRIVERFLEHLNLSPVARLVAPDEKHSCPACGGTGVGQLGPPDESECVLCAGTGAAEGDNVSGGAA